MAKEKKAPQIVNDIVEFVKAFCNPDDLPEDRDSSPIKVYMLNCYSPSYNFIFKWVVMQSQIEEIHKWNPELTIEPDGRTMKMVLGEYKIELYGTDDKAQTELGC
jgi:hypothetical protein